MKPLAPTTLLALLLSLPASGTAAGQQKSPAAGSTSKQAAGSGASRPSVHADALLEAVKARIWSCADAYWHTGRYEDRIALDYVMVELEPRFLEPYTSASYLIWSNGRKSEAEAILKRATAAMPDHWASWAELGEHYMRVRDWAGAVPAYEKATALPNCFVKVWRSLGHAAERTGDLKRSVAAWEGAKRREPDDPVVENNLRRVREALAMKDR